MRTPAGFEEASIAGSTLIPLCAPRGTLAELPREREIIAFCTVSIRGYSAERLLRANGFTRVAVLDGGLAAWPYAKVTKQA